MAIIKNLLTQQAKIDETGKWEYKEYNIVCS